MFSYCHVWDLSGILQLLGEAEKKNRFIKQPERTINVKCVIMVGNGGIGAEIRGKPGK
jgi:hypothetical protein